MGNPLISDAVAFAAIFFGNGKILSLVSYISYKVILAI